MSDTPERAAFEGIQSATILKPGDSVLLVIEGRPSMEMWTRMRATLQERFPFADFACVYGVTDVVVKPSEGSTE